MWRRHTRHKNFKDFDIDKFDVSMWLREKHFIDVWKFSQYYFAIEFF